MKFSSTKPWSIWRHWQSFCKGVLCSPSSHRAHPFWGPFWGIPILVQCDGWSSFLSVQCLKYPCFRDLICQPGVFIPIFQSRSQASLVHGYTEVSTETPEFLSQLCILKHPPCYPGFCHLNAGCSRMGPTTHSSPSREIPPGEQEPEAVRWLLEDFPPYASPWETEPGFSNATTCESWYQSKGIKLEFIQGRVVYFGRDLSGPRMITGLKGPNHEERVKSK